MLKDNCKNKGGGGGGRKEKKILLKGREGGRVLVLERNMLFCRVST